MRRNDLVAILESAQPLTGRGFFEVNKSVMTSIVGAATTYIVVLIQFEQSEQKETKAFNISDI
jgi:hypothetical protein